MDIQIKELQISDLELVKEIYDYYILNTTVTFHNQIITIEELIEFIPINNSKYKSYIIVYEGNRCGYCYISQYKKRQAYDRTSEITIYLKPEFSGKGIGSQAITALEKIAFQNGTKVLIGIISGDNSHSIKLFEKLKYQKCGHYKQVGEKFGKILDVVAYQKIME